MSTPIEIKKKLPKADLIRVRWNQWSHWTRWYVARFRLANAVRYDIGPVTIVHRAPWLEKSSRQLYPHLFDTFDPEGSNMPTVTTTRTASVSEITAEMDRRGSVIEALEAERDRYLEALKNIDSVAVDFGHFETAARTMQEHARKALS